MALARFWLLVLFAGLLYAISSFASAALVAPACQEPASPPKCPGGLYSQCSKDTDCPHFTRCCWDGCFKKCTDTSSQGSLLPRTKLGTCPRVRMLWPCRAVKDACVDDRDCVGDEKCCMDRDCGKKCVLPVEIAEIKKATRAFSCPYVNLDNTTCSNLWIHCRVDSECPLDTKCCFDGCRRRCTNIVGQMVRNKAGITCPFLQAPLACDYPYKGCYDDADCGNGLKCCSDTCNHRCVPGKPQEGFLFPAQAVSVEPTPILDKPGRCPRLEKPANCNPNAYECNYDVDCWDSNKKCCDNGCSTICVTPIGIVGTTTGRPVSSRAISDKPTAKQTTAKRTRKTPTTEEITTMRPTTLKTTPRKTTTTKAPTTTAEKWTTMRPTTMRPTTMRPTTMRPTTMRPTTLKPTTMKQTTRATDMPTKMKTTPEKRTTMKVTTEMTTTTAVNSIAMDHTTGTPFITIPSSTNPWTFPEEVISLMPTAPTAEEGIWIFPSRFMVDIGKVAGASCLVRGEPYEGWYNPRGVKITSTNPRDNIYVAKKGENQFLMIQKADVHHGGKYVCRGAFQEAEYDLEIKVELEEGYKAQYLRQGEVGLIQVSMRGYPLPQYKWIKDKRPLNYKSGRYALGRMGSYLVIKDVRQSDRGMYSLVVNNKMEADISVDIMRDKLKKSCPVLAPPEHCDAIENTCASDGDCAGDTKCCSDSCTNRCTSPEGSTQKSSEVRILRGDESKMRTSERLRVVCLVHKEPFVGWYTPNGRRVTSHTRDHVHVQSYGHYHVLIIRNVTVEDAGKYICQGALHNASVMVEVEVDIGKYGQAVMLVPGETGLVPLSIRSNPPTTFVWYKRGRPLDMSSGRYSVSPSGSLGIRRVRSADMGIYTLKAYHEQGGGARDVGVSVAVAVEGVDFTAWQDTLAPGASVQCHKDVMYIVLEKKVLAGYSIKDLSLKDNVCKAESNSTHYSFMAPLVGCGTESKFTDESVVYSNVVKEFRKKGDMITRVQDVNIPFSCFYTKEGVTSTFGLLPMKVRKVMDGGNATTNFVLGMELYRDESFTVSYERDFFPLRVTVNKPLFVQVKIDSPDKRLNVLADRCYATPTQNPNDGIQYDIIRDGCKVDPTVKSYNGPRDTQRFSFKAFKFIASDQQFVYLHCHLLVCNATDTRSRCARGCEPFPASRLRRSAENTVEAELTQGPLILDNRPQAQTQHKEASSWGLYVWVVIGMAGFCLLCLVAMVYMRKQIAKQRRTPVADPDRETHV